MLATFVLRYCHSDNCNLNFLPGFVRFAKYTAAKRAIFLNFKAEYIERYSMLYRDTPPAIGVFFKRIPVKKIDKLPLYTLSRGKRWVNMNFLNFLHGKVLQEIKYVSI